MKIFLAIGLIIAGYVLVRLKKRQKRPTSAEIDTSYRGPGNF